MEVKGNNYHVFYDPAINTITIQGTLRLRGSTEYDPIVQLLDDVVAQEPNTIKLDLQALRFLNSSGINMLFKFVIKIREQASSKLLVRGSSQISWQKKSLKNMQRLMEDVKLEWV